MIARQSQNVYSTLARLVRLHPQLKENFTLVYDSDSIQFASKLEPRIIFFAPNGLFFSIATNEQSRSIEIIEFNAQTKKFDFIEIQFEGSTPQVDRNPKSCLACHNNRPLWDRYHSWQGVYGSEDDYFFEDRMIHDSFHERSELRYLIRNNRNRFLQLIDLDENDYFLSEFPDRNDLASLFTTKRRNTNLLFHLGYYNLLTYDSHDYEFTFNLSFYRNPDYYSLGADQPTEYAVRTLMFGFEDSDIYDSSNPNGYFTHELNIRSRTDVLRHRLMMREITRRDLLRSKPSVVSKCLSCHIDNAEQGAPEIPFDDFNRMFSLIRNSDLEEKVILRISNQSHGTDRQMPPDRPLTISEQEALSEYLNALKR